MEILTLFGTGIGLMFLGQLGHWIMQLRRELKDPNNSNLSIKDFIVDNRKLMIANFATVAVVAGLYGFGAIPVLGPAALAGAGYSIDSIFENIWAGKLKNGK